MDDSLNIAPGPPWDFFSGKWHAGGEREVFLLASIDEAAPDGNPDVIPLQGAGELTEENRRKLDSQGVPPDCCDDVSIVRDRVSLDPDYRLSREEISTTGQLSRGYVLRQLEEFLNSVEKTAVIHYIGHGKKRTGDWWFSDGFITFRDIVHLYNTTKIKGRVLAIVSNCSHSGSWVEECCRYLDEQGVRACGHSAAEKGILLKVYASCRPSQVANALTFSVWCMENDKNTRTLSYRVGTELTKSQNAFWMDCTTLRCGKTPQDPCSMTSPEYTWTKASQGDRLYLVWGKDCGRPVWHYVLLVDDEETKQVFEEKVKSGTVDVALYGEVLRSGCGEDPPNELRDELDKQYGIVYK